MEEKDQVDGKRAPVKKADNNAFNDGMRIVMVIGIIFVMAAIVTSIVSHTYTIGAILGLILVVGVIWMVTVFSKKK